METMVRLLVLLLLVPARTAAADDELDVPGLDAADLRGDALVWEDATFFLEPWESGAKIPAFNSFGRRRDEVGRAVPVRIVDSTSRTFVEIELTGRADCTWRRLEIDRRVDHLRLFVRREDLAPMLVKPFATQYSDGTRVKLAPGVPIVPTAAGDYFVAVKQDKLRLPIPHASVGYLYKATKVGDPEPAPGKFVRLDRTVSVKIGDDAFSMRSSWVAPAPEKRGTDETLVTWKARCLELVVSVPSQALRPTETPRPIPQAPQPAPVATSGWRVPPGVPMSTPGGREVAVASAAIGVPAPTAGATTACTDLRFSLVREDEYYQSQYRTVKLCAPTVLLER